MSVTQNRQEEEKIEDMLVHSLGKHSIFSFFLNEARVTVVILCTCKTDMAGRVHLCRVAGNTV